MELISVWYDSVQRLFPQSERLSYPPHKSRLIVKIGRQKDTPFRWSGQSFCAKSVQPLYQNAPFALPNSAFYQTGWNLISKGYSLSLSLFQPTSFLSTSATKEKILCYKPNIFFKNDRNLILSLL